MVCDCWRITVNRQADGAWTGTDAGYIGMRMSDFNPGQQHNQSNTSERYPAPQAASSALSVMVH